MARKPAALSALARTADGGPCCRAEQCLKPVARFGRVATQEPEPAERSRQPQADVQHLRVLALERPTQRLPEVVLLALESGSNCRLLRSLQLRSGLLGECGEVLRVTAADCVSFAARLQRGERELAGGLEHAEPELAGLAPSHLGVIGSGSSSCRPVM